MCREPILGCQITLHAWGGVAEEARVERDVEEQKERTSERVTEKGDFQSGRR